MAYIPPAIATEVTLLASFARTATTNSPTQTNTSWRGVTLFLNVTVAVAAQTLTVLLQFRDPISGLFSTVFTSVAVTVTGLYAFQVYPAAAGAAGSQSLNLPRQWRAQVAHSAGGSWTYSLAAGLGV